MNLTSLAKGLVVTVICIFINYGAWSQQSVEENLTPKDQEFIKIMEAAGKVATHGPADISLIDQAVLKIPEGYLFIPKKEAVDFMSFIGNKTSENFIGLIMSPNDDLRWFIDINYIKAGYVKDDDAKKINPNTILKDIKDSTEEANKERIAQGVSALDVVKWIEEPSYNPSTHHLIWSILAKNRGTSDVDGQVVNYDVGAFGREGFFKFVLITPASHIEQDKLHILKLLEALHYNTGKRYEDFAEATDKVAKYGLIGLITGIAAKKVGLLALAGVFLAKIWKIIIIGCVVFLVKIKSFFKREKKSKD
jgi:uncharacterized membrane-anchored protein